MPSHHDPSRDAAQPAEEWPVYDPSRSGDAVDEPRQYGGSGGYGSSIQDPSPYGSAPSGQSPYGMAKHGSHHSGTSNPYDMPTSRNHPYRTSNSWSGHSGSGVRSSRDLVKFLWFLPFVIVLLSSTLFEGRPGLIGGPMFFIMVAIAIILRRR